MSNRKRSIFTPELSTVKSLNEADTDELWIPAQQVTDDAVVKVSVSQLGGDISSKINHQGTYNRGDLNAHPQYTLTSSFNTLSSSLAGEYLKRNGSNSPTGNINWNYFDIYNPSQISSDSGITFNATTFNFVAVDETYFTSPYMEFAHPITLMDQLHFQGSNEAIYRDSSPGLGFVAGGDDVAFFLHNQIQLMVPTICPRIDVNGIPIAAAADLVASTAYPPYSLYTSGAFTGQMPKAYAMSEMTGLQMSVKWGSAKYENGFSLTDFGNAGFQAPTSTNYQSRMQLGIYYTVGTAGNSAGAYDTNDIVYMGNAWVWHARVAPNMTNLTQQRGFFGLQSGKAVIGNVNPSTLTNIIGFGYDATDTNIQFMRNDGSGTATKTSTGISARTTGMVLDLWICCNGNGTVRAFCQRLDAAGGYVGGNVTTDLPSSTAFLNPIIWTNNNAQAAAAWCGVQKIIIETI